MFLISPQASPHLGNFSDPLPAPLAIYPLVRSRPLQAAIESSAFLQSTYHGE